MKWLVFILLIHYTYAQDGSNASNTTTDGPANISTTTLRGVTTTLVSTTTTGGTNAPTTTTGNATKVQTTTLWPMDQNTTTLMPDVPYCSGNSSYNGTCKVCLGPLCKFVENGEEGVGWEILFVAAFLTFSGLTCLGLYYVCLKPILTKNTAEDLQWSSDSEDEEWHETAQMLTKQDIRRKGSKEFEIVDLNPVNNKN
jgi:hypothetical protein